MPIKTANVIDKSILEAANSHPKMLPVYTIAKMLVAGAVYRNAIAGPMPAPFFFIPANNGSIVHEHTASNKPATTDNG